ncbi:MAG: flavodoxin family protein [Evtepia sp.]
MKILLTYSSKTGNTRLVAEAIGRGLNTPPVSMDTVPDCRGFDLVIVGFWIDKGLPNKEARQYIETLSNVPTAFFFTLGAEADSKHAMDCREKAKEYFRKTELTGDFCCQGKISPALIRVLKHLPAWFPHGPNPERIARWECAASHPDDADLAAAAEYFRKLCAV